MKKNVWIICCLLLGVVFIAVAYFSKSNSIEVNNTTPASQIITIDHGLKKLLLAEAVFGVEDGFADVLVRDFAERMGITLECKRSCTPCQSYYVIFGDGYRGYIIVDENEFIQDVLVVKQFATMQEAKGCLKEFEDLGVDLDLTEATRYSLDQNWRTCGHSSGYWHRLFTLRDGVIIMKEPYPLSTEPTEYYYFSDDEWKTACEKWNGFIILPIDKQ